MKGTLYYRSWTTQIGIRRIQEVVTNLKIWSYQLRDVATALGHSVR